MVKPFLDKSLSIISIKKIARNLFFPFPPPYSLKSTVLIEISSNCNAKCIFCNYRMSYRTRSIISVEQFTKIAKSCVAGGFQFLNLTSAGGENTLNPEFVDIIIAGKKAGFKYIGTYTNGILLHRFDPGKLLTSGINEIAISFPSFEPEYFKSIYGVNAFNDFRKSIEGLLTEHARTDSSVKIIFEPRTLLNEEELRNAPFYKTFVRGFLNDRITIIEPLRVFDSWCGAIKQKDLLPGMRLARITRKSIPFKRIYLCNRMFPFSILCNGDVRFCGCVYDSTVETENDPLYVDSLKNHCDFNELMKKNKEKIKQIRIDFINGRLPSLCRKCTLYTPVITKGMEL